MSKQLRSRKLTWLEKKFEIENMRIDARKIGMAVIIASLIALFLKSHDTISTSIFAAIGLVFGFIIWISGLYIRQHRSEDE